MQTARASAYGLAMSFHLHIGAHKTATTHMQATLKRHRAMLEAAGVQFAAPDEVRTLIGAGRRAAAKMGAMPSLRRSGAARRLARLDRGAERLVISDENSLGRCAEIFEQNCIYPTAGRQLMIWRRLAAKRPTTVYLGVREYGAFFSGAYIQSIRGAQAYRPDESDRAALARLPRRWPDIVADVRQALPGAHLRVWAFEDYPALSHHLLAEMTGQSLTPVNRRPMATPSGQAVDAYLANPQGGAAAITHLAADHPITGDNPRFSLWSQAEEAALNDIYQADLATLRDDLAEDFIRT